MTAGKILKRLHVKAVRGNRFISLKFLARELLKEGTEEEKLAVQGWLLNKSPAQRRLDKADRLKRKGASLSVIREATRSAKRKRSAGSTAKSGK